MTAPASGSLANTSSAVTALADEGVSAAQTALNALLAAKFPGLAGIVIPLVGEGAVELESLLATYVPQLISAGATEIETLWSELIAKLKALFAKHVSWPQTDAEMIVYFVAANNPRADQNATYPWGWKYGSIMDNKVAIGNEITRRGLQAQATAALVAALTS